MDDLGTEVGQKMRSAVKAKLIELGTGGSAGYIDDELPDYVMIMVANKRSKQQMIGDLNLFLGSNTDLFVTWLHEVLQKLQEVTLPANVMQKAKRKTNETDSLPITKKEKKDKKRDKKSKRNEKQYDEISGTSISDVFADHILHNAKKTMEIEADAKIKQKNEISPRTTDEFDIPTITEISEQQKQTDHNDNSSIRKDLTELAEIQKKIYQAKRQLKAIETDESEDEDFLNINDGEEFLEDVADKANKRNHKVKSPIIFDSDMTTTTTVTTTVTTLAPATITETPTPLTPIKNSEINENSNILEQEKMKKRITITFNNEEERRRSELRRETQQSESSPILAVSPVSLHKKRSIHERLGIKSILTPNSSKHSENVISLSTHRRIEKEIYVPVFRRKEFDKDQEKDRERDRDRDRDYVRDRERDRERDVRGRSREYQDKNKDEKISIRKRIGSRVIVAPPKPEYNDDEDDVIDRPVSSMIKVKPRPPISPSKQANKNLLLRAVAEAQKSTALFKQKKDRAPSLSPPSSTQQQSLRSQKLYSKSYRNRNREAILKRAIKDNIVIEVNSEKIPSTTISSRINKLNDDEYIPEPISDRGDSDTDYIYVPQIINSGNSDDENMSYDDELINNRNQTQFVVTLDDKSRDNFVSTLEENLNEMQIEKIDNNKTNNINSIITTTTTTTRSTSTITTGTGIQLRKPQNNQQKIKIIPEKRKDIINYRTDYKQDVKKLIIKNDTDDEMMGLEDKTTIEDIETNNKDITINNNNNNNTNDNKNDNVKDQIEERSTTPPLPKKPISSSENKIQFSPLKKRKRSTVSPIKFDLNVNEDNDGQRSLKRRSKSDEPDSSKKPNETYNKDDRNEDNHKVQTKKPDGYKKYDNIPQLLSSVSVESVSVKNKTKERCKYYPQCGKGDTCEFFHPSTPCKAFPNCKFVDKCLYLHPKCKFDLTCKRIVCNFSHSSMPAIQTSAPPLSSHVVPVQNYKTITPSLLPALCKFYPNCTNSACSFYHPKLCRFGKNCMNKVECNFYHHDLPNKDKFKWVASLG